ncbi:MAG: outer membrane beta-barrel protein [Bacteroidales bacterium]|nr:outer membrane beta-barrel protein [Bacteroidales bacterium]
MQDKHTQDFDLQMRSMLADAEIKPSRRVWKAVSARLDAAEASAAPVWGWMRWAGASLAVAAVAATLFFTGTRHSIPTKIHNQEQAMLAQAGGDAGTPTQVAAPATVPAGETPDEAVSATPIRRRSAPVRPAGEPVVSPEAATAPSSDGQEALSQKQEAPVQEQQTAPAKKQPRQPVRTVTADPFAEPVTARQSFKPRVALYAQGAIGSNESDFRPAGAMMAPGKSSGFSELGSSSYGIPFTLGLGVRIYLLPRFSLGTGLDYSLLTRSFTGSYGDVSGSVSHSLQYLGIPINLYYDILSSDKIKFYVYGGGEMEYCISNKYRLFANPDIIRSYPVEGLQFSVGGGIGVEFMLGRRVGLYLDPGVNYYFPGNQPRNIRTDKPFLLNFDAGLRFNF